MSYKRDQKKLQKRRTREKAIKFRKAVIRLTKNHNKVKYRKIPGAGIFPYQHAPISYNQAFKLLKTGQKPTADTKMQEVAIA